MSIMLALCLLLCHAYYAQNYASTSLVSMAKGLSALIEKVQCHSARFVMNDYL